MYAKKALLALPLFIILCTMQMNAQNSETVEKRTLTTPVGKEFPIKVHENGTTGFLWFWLTNDAPTHNPIQLVRKETIVKKTKKMLVGSGQDVNWIFQATTPGTHHISMVYKRPWEQSIGQYLEVTVEAAA